MSKIFGGKQTKLTISIIIVAVLIFSFGLLWFKVIPHYEVITILNNSTYYGSVVNGYYDGYGRFESVTGMIYEGYWKRGKMNGAGVITTLDGTTVSAEFVDNVPIGIKTTVYPDGTIIEKDASEDENIEIPFLEEHTHEDE